MMDMKEILPVKLYELAVACPFPLYVVGGVCRDCIAGLTPEKCDWDICAPASAEMLERVAVRCGFTVRSVYRNTGTVKLTAEGEEYEFACFRSDRYVRGMHLPADIAFTDDIALDARRRDFKCNAVYYDIVRGQFVDPLGGTEDIRRRRLSTVAPAEKVFGEDGLRLMRLARLAAQLGFAPDEPCMEGARANCTLIDDISAERIWAELNAVLHADAKYGIQYGQYAGLKILRDTGVLARILPELALGDGMAQRSDYHDYDVLEHSLRAVMYADDRVRLAALLHDVGKPRQMLGTGKFALHEASGAEIARDICRRLRVPKKLAEETEKLILLHMYDLNGLAKPNKVRRFIVSHSDVFEKLLLLKQTDYSACKDDLSVAPCVAKWKRIYGEMCEEGVPLTVGQLKVRGDDLIAAGICPDQVGKTLDFLLSRCAVDAGNNDRDKLLKEAAKFNHPKFTV